MEPPEVKPSLEIRLKNYHKEAVAILCKLVKPDVPPGKKEKLEYRLYVILSRLLPDTICEMQGAY